MGKPVYSIVAFVAGMLLMLCACVFSEGNETISSSTRLTKRKGKNLKKVGMNYCNVFEGEWVWDNSYPMYNSEACPFVRHEYDCIKYGRPNREYLMYRWQPKDCDLPRFDGRDFLERFKGKKIMYVGDSLSMNNFDSLVCLLHAANPAGSYTVDFKTINFHNVTTVIFQDYGIEVTIFTSQYLVDIEMENIGSVLKVDSMKDGEIWKQADVLIFNTWLWWPRRKPKQPWDYIREGEVVVQDMDRVELFRKGFGTWTKWVETQVDHNKTKVFFQSVTGAHYNGTVWGQPEETNCLWQTKPIMGSTYPGIVPLPADIVKETLKAMTKPVQLLDLTILSLLRKDGHPSAYNNFKAMDCTHWCVGGVPDTWNRLLYALLLSQTTN